MKEALFEICGAILAIGCFAATRIYTDTSDALVTYLAMLAGTTAGAVIGVFGGKKFMIFDTGADGWAAKAACHFAITVIFGPMTLQWALLRWPDMEPMGVASAVGGILALAGTNILVMVAPVVSTVVNSLLKKWIPAPIQPATPAPPPPPSNPSSPVSP